MGNRTPYSALKHFPVLALGLWLLLNPLFALAQESVVQMKLRDQQLSVRLHEAPLEEVIGRLEQAGIWVKGKNHITEQKVSLTFENLPFREAFRRILAGVNYCLVYDANDRLQGLVLVGVGKARVAPPPQPAQPVKPLRSKKAKKAKKAK